MRITKLLQIFIFSVMIFSAGRISAQIQITSQDILGLIGNTIEAEIDTTESIVVSVGSPGTNQTWDFSNVKVNGEPYTYEFIVPAGTPFAGEFPDANFVEKATFTDSGLTISTYAYHEVTPTVFTSLGQGFISDGFQQVFVEEDDTAPMPLTYGSAWTSNSVDTLTAVEGFVSLVKVTSENTVDAWGTVKLPSGDFQSLRLKELSVEIAETSFNGVPVFSDTSHSISYTWIAKNVLTLVSIGAPENVTDPNFTEAATFIWSTDNNINTIEGLSDHSVPGNFILEQNYPNPFNPVTQINYTIPKQGQVKLDIYDTRGQIVATLFNKNQSAGTYTVEWNATGYPSGVYFYRLKTAGEILTKKMMLVK